MEFKDLYYRRGERKIIDKLSFKIKAGERVLISGKSGEGKTTIVDLIFGYLKYDSGEILISKKRVSEISLKTIRENIGYLSQTVLLFKGSLKENLLLNKDVDGEEFKLAIKNAGLQEIIKTLPKGLDTEVGEMGFTLSGGERKRIGLFRVFIKDCPIVILDEPYAGVDIGAREKIKKVIEVLFKEKTVIVISHDEGEEGYDRVLELGRINNLNS